MPRGNLFQRFCYRLDLPISSIASLKTWPIATQAVLKNRIPLRTSKEPPEDSVVSIFSLLEIMEKHRAILAGIIAFDNWIQFYRQLITLSISLTVVDNQNCKCSVVTYLAKMDLLLIFAFCHLVCCPSKRHRQTFRSSLKIISRKWPH